ncbi:MAG: SDR family oxidoreductase [Gemmataceae bacterium]
MRNFNETLSRNWSEAINNLISYQRDLFEVQYQAGQRVLESMWRSPQANGGTEHEAATPATEATPKANGETQSAGASQAGPKANEEAKAAPDKLAAPQPQPAEAVQPRREAKPSPKIQGKVALVTGAASGIGEAVVRKFVEHGAKAVILVDLNERVNDLAGSINDGEGRVVVHSRIGDTTDEEFRKHVFDEVVAEHGVVSICVPAAGITRDRLAVKVDKTTGSANIYPKEDFRKVTEVNLIAPIYWAMEMVARIAEDRWKQGKKRWVPEEGVQGTIVLIGSVSSQGNKGQISYAVAKAGLEGAASTLMKEAIFYGVRCGVIHPGFTDTPMVRALGEEYIAKNILPYTQLRRLIRPQEIADAICFMVSNSAVSGELWADAGWHPSV